MCELDELIYNEGHPYIKWSQTEEEIKLILQFHYEINKEEIDIEISQHFILKYNKNLLLQLKLYNPCKLKKKVFSSNRIYIYMIKLNYCTWPRFISFNKRIIWISTDWKTWDDINEKSNDLNPITSQYILGPIQYDERDQNDIYNSPSLNLILLNDNQLKEFWINQVTSAQRLYTLLLLWNISTKPQRQIILQNLIEMMNEKNQKLSDSIKGGEHILEELNSEVYSKHNIKYVLNWISEYQHISNDIHRIEIMKYLFLHINDEEKILVTSSFI